MDNWRKLFRDICLGAIGGFIVVFWDKVYSYIEKSLGSFLAFLISIYLFLALMLLLMLLIKYILRKK